MSPSMPRARSIETGPGPAKRITESGDQGKVGITTTRATSGARLANPAKGESANVLILSCSVR
ncbi:MAG: hypothetical protein AVDCRST_MAG55-534 [uncultured Rubrobacteraceae bacterium]|uniref:Uncharacterized protein n=1 Tax=uncultured Rubrobacteraceae bacterium TaxID=349277 RepID=A0A6J4NVT3_9ACTN|nr:MAG: hypothetical protein AVDCRST_MAG55-534 [uncultured Rubrobacteraceae bacterium]